MLFSVVTLDGLGLNNHRGVAALVVLTLRGHGTRDVAGGQTERYRNACHDRRGDGHYHLVNLLFSHNS